MGSLTASRTVNDGEIQKLFIIGWFPGWIKFRVYRVGIYTGWILIIMTDLVILLNTLCWANNV